MGGPKFNANGFLMLCPLSGFEPLPRNRKKQISEKSVEFRASSVCLKLQGQHPFSIFGGRTGYFLFFTANGILSGDLMKF